MEIKSFLPPVLNGTACVVNDKAVRPRTSSRLSRRETYLLKNHEHRAPCTEASAWIYTLGSTSCQCLHCYCNIPLKPSELEEYASRSRESDCQNGDEFCDLQPGLQPPGCRYDSRLSNIHHRSLCKMFRNARGQYCHFGDAVLDLTCGADPLAPQVTDQEYQGPSWHIHLSTTFSDRFLTARLDHLRTYLPYNCPSHSPEPEETSRCVGRPDIPLRYPDDEVAIHNRDVSKSYG